MAKRKKSPSSDLDVADKVLLIGGAAVAGIVVWLFFRASQHNQSQTQGLGNCGCNDPATIFSGAQPVPLTSARAITPQMMFAGPPLRPTPYPLH